MIFMNFVNLDHRRTRAVVVNFLLTLSLFLKMCIIKSIHHFIKDAKNQQHENILS